LQKENALQKQFGEQTPSWKPPCVGQASPGSRFWTRYNKLVSSQSFSYRTYVTWSC